MLEDNVILTSDTSLYCVSESNDTSQVKWSYIDLAGTRSVPTSTTNTTTGVSILHVYTTQPGYYTCEVSENGGSSRTYTIGLLNTDSYTGIMLISGVIRAVNYSTILPVDVTDNNNYTYTIGIDRGDIYLWYPLQTDKSVPLTDIVWKRENIPGEYPNPLPVYSLVNFLKQTGNTTLECLDRVSGDSYVTVKLSFQGMLVFDIFSKPIFSECMESSFQFKHTDA